MLRSGDIVDIVAPSYGCSPDILERVVQLVKSWNLTPRVPSRIFDDDLLCASPDDVRFEQLRHALFDTESRCVWALRGGYGTNRIADRLIELKRPVVPKLFIGMSDATVVHAVLNARWEWPSLHGPNLKALACGEVSATHADILRDLILSRLDRVVVDALTPLNDAARRVTNLSARIHGGNLSLVQSLIGTRLHPDYDDWLFLEDIGETPYRIDRMLNHLRQAGLLARARGIVFGTFILPGEELGAPAKVEQVLRRFSSALDIPVFGGIPAGHGSEQLPLFLNAPSHLEYDGYKATLCIDTPRRLDARVSVVRDEVAAATYVAGHGE